jgi:aryl-alcohol dehydrogenase-like predicted oxidoreductase
MGDTLMASLTERRLRRREFLTISAGAVVSAAVFPHVAAGQKAPEGEWRNRQPGMTYRRLGRTGLMVSSIGMGGDDIRPAGIDYVLWAVDQGLNYFDTAPQYGGGQSERGYALVLKARGRDKVFQNTKVNAHPNRTTRYREIFASLPESEQADLRKKAEDLVAQRDLENPDYLGPYFTGQASGMRSAIIANLVSEKYRDKFDSQKDIKQYIFDSVERSLKALETDHVDCLLMRGIETPYEVKSTPEVFEAFETLKKQGKARFLGFTAHSDPAGVLDAAIDTGVYSMGMIAYHFLNHTWVDPILEKAKKADFGVMAMKASRVIQNPFNRRETQPDRVKALNALVPGDMTVFQKGFHWALQNPNLSGVVIGITNMEMAKEDIPLAFEKRS